MGHASGTMRPGVLARPSSSSPVSSSFPYRRTRPARRSAPTAAGGPANLKPARRRSGPVTRTSASSRPSTSSSLRRGARMQRSSFRERGPVPRVDENHRHFAGRGQPEQVAQKFGILNAVRIPGADLMVDRPRSAKRASRCPPGGARRVLRCRPPAAAGDGVPLARLPRSYDRFRSSATSGPADHVGVREDPGLSTIRSARWRHHHPADPPVLVAAYPIVFLFALNAAEEVTPSRCGGLWRWPREQPRC